MAAGRVTEDLRITGVILAGGQGRRMGTIDKGLVSIDGRPMVAHVLDRLRPQVDEILINANQHRVEYEAFGYPVLPALYIASAGLIEVLLLLYKPNYTWPGLIIVLLGLPVYFIWRRRATI